MSADDPVMAAKITAPGVPGWVVPRPRITKLIAEGVCGGWLKAIATTSYVVYERARAQGFYSAPIRGL